MGMDTTRSCIRQLRDQLENDFDLPAGALYARNDEIKAAAYRVIPLANLQTELNRILGYRRVLQLPEDQEPYDVITSRINELTQRVADLEES